MTGAGQSSTSERRFDGTFIDCVLLGSLAGLTYATVTVPIPAILDAPIARFVFGVALLCVAPGYLVLAVLVPTRQPPGTGVVDAAVRRRGIDLPARLALAVGLSIGLAPVFGMTIGLSSAGYGTESTATVLSGIVGAGTILAALRRLRVPASRRFRLPWRDWLAAGRSATVGAERTRSALMNVALVLVTLLTVSTLVYAFAVPQTTAGTYTGFSLLTETQSGELVASEYPRTFEVGDAEPLVVSVSNHEQRRQTYTVVVTLENTSGPGAAEQTELGRFANTVSAGETWYARHGVTAGQRGTNLKLTYYLYRGSAPPDPAAETAYRELHLWVDVRAQTGA